MHQKTQNRFLKFSIHLSVRKSRENYRQIYGKSKASLWINLSTGTPPNCFRTILCFVALVYSTLDSHTNTVISHTFAYSSRWLRKPWRGLFAHEIEAAARCKLAQRPSGQAAYKSTATYTDSRTVPPSNRKSTGVLNTGRKNGFTERQR